MPVGRPSGYRHAVGASPTFASMTVWVLACHPESEQFVSPGAGVSELGGLGELGDYGGGWQVFWPQKAGKSQRVGRFGTDIPACAACIGVVGTLRVTGCGKRVRVRVSSPCAGSATALPVRVSAAAWRPAGPRGPHVPVASYPGRRWRRGRRSGASPRPRRGANPSGRCSL